MWFLDSHDNIYQPAVDLSQRFGWNHFKPQLLLYYWQMPLYIIKGVQHPQQTTHQRLSLRLHHINRGSKRHIDCRFVCTQTLFVNKAWCASSCHMSHLLTIWPSSCCTRRAPRPPPPTTTPTAAESVSSRHLTCLTGFRSGSLPLVSPWVTGM